MFLLFEIVSFCCFYYCSILFFCSSDLDVVVVASSRRIDVGFLLISFGISIIHNLLLLLFYLLIPRDAVWRCVLCVCVCVYVFLFDVVVLMSFFIVSFLSPNSAPPLCCVLHEMFFLFFLADLPRRFLPPIIVSISLFFFMHENFCYVKMFVFDFFYSLV